MIIFTIENYINFVEHYYLFSQLGTFFTKVKTSAAQNITPQDEQYSDCVKTNEKNSRNNSGLLNLKNRNQN